MVTLPRVMVAAPGSSHGKTTVAVGLMAALTRAGATVAAAKVGADYIDPGFHSLAVGRPSRNLDPMLTSPELVPQLLRRAAQLPTPADLTVVEGVMGLFDGRLGTDGFASSAHVAALTGTPVVLVVDVSHASRTIAALVCGLARFDPAVQVAGVIINKAGSTRHADEVRRAITASGIRVLGAIPRDAGLHLPSRHLGLIPAAERDRAAQPLDVITEAVATYVDLDAVREIARAASDLDAPEWNPADVTTALNHRITGSPLVAMFGGRAFTFRYPETRELLEAAGCRVHIVDPARDQELPSDTSAIYIGGGFPEVHAQALSRNVRLRSEVRQATSAGMPTVAECAGLLYLAQTLDGSPMADVVPTQATMGPRLTLGYRDAELATDSILGPAGTTATGHEFHRTTVDGSDSPAWLLSTNNRRRPEGFALDPASTGRATVVASYLHTHWAGHPRLATAFAQAASQFAAQAPAFRAVGDKPIARAVTEPAALPTDPLDHHGDQEVDGSLIDLAVNVRVSEPPAWLSDRLRSAVSSLATYPRLDHARRAIAQVHGVDPDRVLLTAGADEAFTLIARCGLTDRPAIIHPQFTEPESALRRAGHQPIRIILREQDDFRITDRTTDDLQPATSGGPDLIVGGNPTNPTGVLHARTRLETLRSPGRLLVIDEAFLDAVPGCTETFLQEPFHDDVIVIRSLTKTWGLAGLRVGYLVAAPALVDRLRAAQQHWPVSSLAAEAVTAVSTPAALREAADAAHTLSANRRYLSERLQQIGVPVVAGDAPFVLARPGSGAWQALRDHGFAVRRADTFPGLDDRWIRIAARDELTTDALTATLSALNLRETAR